MLRWNNLGTALYQRCAMLFRRSFNINHWRIINVVQRWKSDVRFYFIFNVGWMLFWSWSTRLEQRWSDIEMLPWWFLILKLKLITVDIMETMNVIKTGRNKMAKMMYLKGRNFRDCNLLQNKLLRNSFLGFRT